MPGYPIRTVVAVGLIAGLAAACAPRPERDMAASQPDTAIVYMEYITVAAPETPQGMALLPLATSEAEVAAQHARLAAQRPDDLDWMKLHAAHVLHAVAPRLAPPGPGLGYGVEQAARDISRQVRLAARAPGANAAMQTHAGHVATAAGNVVTWSEAVTTLAQAVQVASQPEEAAEKVDRMVLLTGAILTGNDADGDGTVTWRRGEGGLAQAEAHMDLMATASAG